MSKKFTWDKNGKMTSEDENPEKEIAQHDTCIKEEQIELIRKNVEKLEVKSYSDSEAIAIINEKLNGIIKRQDDNKLWIRGAVFGFAIFIFGLIYYGITDHNSVQALPKILNSFVTYDDFMKYLKDQSELNIYLKSEDDKLKMKDQLIDKQLERIDDNFKYLRITRGLPKDYKEPPTKINGRDPEKEYQESLKNKPK